MISRVCVSLPSDYITYIDSQPGLSFSEKLRRIIERDRAREVSAASVTISDIDINKYPDLEIEQLHI